jgi:hypothetical protein
MNMCVDKCLHRPTATISISPSAHALLQYVSSSHDHPQDISDENCCAVTSVQSRVERVVTFSEKSSKIHKMLILADCQQRTLVLVALLDGLFWLCVCTDYECFVLLVPHF